MKEPVDPRHVEGEVAPGPFDGDEQLAISLRKMLPRGACKSIIIADFEDQRGAVRCVAKGKGHDCHEAACGDLWYLKDDGHWGMDVVALSNVNTAFAGKRPIDA